ncbi:hypothetical protein FRB96_004743 [Tulasnella sp. 330]|nr:hypothetical protein FRB96_004743 [Tulasnella sp. 330]KAG8876781.1 hypothetical protein FRB97_003932 [Tulasnella sp. 331]KAG8882043.1 hypothetical protein FRB98_003961 [Tulasnella sp. 332]
MDAHHEHYQGFVEDGRTWAQHVASMRQAATYGGHLELCAFAHLKHRNVKVIQPGLVYVIEWSTGPNDDNPLTTSSASSSSRSLEASSSTSEAASASDAGLTGRELRRARRERMKEAKHQAVVQAFQDAPAVEQQPDLPALYVAYHDWEHFSSVRNISGPHQGIPNVVETAAPASDQDLDDQPTSTTSARQRTQKVASHLKPPSDNNNIISDVRSPSPSTTTATMSTQNTDLSSSLSSGPPRTPPESIIANAAHAIFSSRSPKRSFEESDDVNTGAGEEGSGSEYGRASTKRTRPRGLSVNQDVVVDDDDTGAPEAASSNEEEGDDDDEDDNASGYSSVCSSSAAPSPVPPLRQPKSRAPVRHAAPTMTKRERKRRGKTGITVVPPAVARPKPKRVILLLGKKGSKDGAAKVGGGKTSEEDARDGKAEWMSNGTGKMDVRGFRELKI